MLTAVFIVSVLSLAVHVVSSLVGSLLISESKKEFTKKAAEYEAATRKLEESQDEADKMLAEVRAIRERLLSGVANGDVGQA